MLRNVFLKTMWDQRRSLTWWSLGLGLTVAILVAFYPSIEGIEGLDEMLAQYPEDLMALLGATDIASFATPAGYLSGELFGLMLPILFAVFAIGLGSGAIAGEEQAGTMEILLSQPIRRGRLVLQKFASISVSTAILALMVWLVLIAGKFAIDMDISLIRLLEMTISLGLLGLAFGAAAFALGCSTGRRGMSTGIAAALAVGTFLLNSLSLIVEFMEPVKWLSPFHYYNGSTSLVDGLDLLHAAILFIIVLACVGFAYFGFQRRDVRQA